MSTGLTQLGNTATSFFPPPVKSPQFIKHQKRFDASLGLTYTRFSNKPSLSHQHHPHHAPWSSTFHMTQESTKSPWFLCRSARKANEVKPRAVGQCTISSPSSKATMTRSWPLESDWLECRIPQPVFALFVYLAQRGVHVNDLFRRPGNISQMKQILQQFTTGQAINWTEYNVYTVANVAKKVLLAIPGGLLGPGGEKKLLATASFACVADAEAAVEHVYRLDPNVPPTSRVSAKLDERPRSPSVWPYKPFLVSTPAAHSMSSEGDDPCQAVKEVSWPRGSVQQLNQLSEVAERRIAVFQRILDGLPPSHNQLAILVFGILHQMVFHAASTAERSGMTFHPGMDLKTFSTTTAAETLTLDTDCSEPRVPLLTIAEGVVKSVAGTLFHTCSASVLSVEQAAQVLRSLVLCFPALGESVTRFYVNAVHGHLRFSPLIGTGMTIEKATCALCPKSTHSTYFGPHDSPNDSRSCPFGLIQAASRLFCLAASSTASSATPVHDQQRERGSSAISTPKGARFRCPPFVGKSHESPRAGDVTKPCPVVVVYRTPSPVASLCSCELAVTEPAVTSAVTSLACSAAVPRNVEDTQITITSTSDHPPVKVQLDCAPAETKHVITLRRHQSRYRSLRRRQMENLSRRAEWFLGPTTIPTVTISPVRSPPDSWVHSHVIQSASEVHLSPNSIQQDAVVTSTVSLLELGENPIDSELSDESGHCCRLTGKGILEVPPRLLFTASTGELGQNECSESFRSEAPHSAVVHRPDSGSRPRHLSVGSYLSPPFPAPSFVSIHSAPSADFTRAIRVEDADYFRSAPLHHPPNSSTDHPNAVRSCMDRRVELTGYEPAHQPITSLQRPLLVGRAWCASDCCYSSSSAHAQVPNIASCSALVVTCDAQLAPATICSSMETHGPRDNPYMSVPNPHRNSTTLAIGSPPPATARTWIPGPKK